MDGTLENSKYMNFKPDEGFERISKLMSRVKENGGIFSLLWHNSSFEYGGWKKWEWVYLKTLETVKTQEFSFILDIDVLRLFGDRNAE